MQGDVTSAHFDDKAKRWTVKTDQGDTVTAQFCIMAVGCLSAANKPPFEGIDDFNGPQRTGVARLGRVRGVVDEARPARHGHRRLGVLDHAARALAARGQVRRQRRRRPALLGRADAGGVREEQRPCTLSVGGRSSDTCCRW